MPSSHISSKFHLVFSTKERKSTILDEWENRLHSYLGGIIKGMDAVPLAIGGVSDHVHILLSLKSGHRLDYVLRDIKADSTGWVRKEFSKLFEWQKGYGAFSVSPLAVENVKAYISKQKEHHANVRFEDEYVALLERAGISYDEKYLW